MRFKDVGNVVEWEPPLPPVESVKFSGRGGNVVMWGSKTAFEPSIAAIRRALIETRWNRLELQTSPVEPASRPMNNPNRSSEIYRAVRSLAARAKGG